MKRLALALLLLVASLVVAGTVPGASAAGDPSIPGDPSVPVASGTPLPFTGSALLSTGDADVKLPLAGFADMVVDQRHGRIYFTGGPGIDTVVVTDLQGVVVKTLVLSGAEGMAMSPDRKRLYAASGDRDGIMVVDTATLATSWIFVGTQGEAYSCPRDLAFASGVLWFSWGCGDGGINGLGLVDPRTKEYSLDEAPFRVYNVLVLAIVPSQPSTLFASETGRSSGPIYRFHTTPTGAVLRAAGSAGGFVRQIAPTPDGSRIIVPSGSPYVHQVFRAKDLVRVSAYETTAYPNAAAIRPDGMVAAGVNGDPDVSIFEPGGTTPGQTYEFGSLPDRPSWRHRLEKGALAWAGNRLYAVTEDPSEPERTLRILESPLPAPALTLRTDQGRYDYGDSATLDIHLGATSTNRKVSVYAQPYGRARRLLQTMTVRESGDATLRTTVARMTNFSVRFSGDASNAPSFAARLVKVRAKTTNTLGGYYATFGKWRVYHEERSPTLRARVEPLKPRECVYLRIERRVDGAWKHLRTTDCRRLSSTSKLATSVGFRHAVGSRYRVRTTFRGDPANLARDAGWLHFRFTH